MLLITILGWCVLSNAQSMYFPLEKGQEMIYAYGEDFNQGNNDLRFITKVLDSTKVVNDKTYFIVIGLYGSQGNLEKIKESYTRKAADGTVFLLDDNALKESIVIKPTLTVGDTWNRSNGELISTVELISLKGTLKSPSATYSDCLVLESLENGVKVRSYFQQGKGMVGMTMMTEEKEKLFTYLISE